MLMTTVLAESVCSCNKTIFCKWFLVYGLLYIATTMKRQICTEHAFDVFISYTCTRHVSQHVVVRVLTSSAGDHGSPVLPMVAQCPHNVWLT